MAFNIWTGIPVVASTVLDSIGFLANSEAPGWSTIWSINIQETLNKGINSLLITSSNNLENNTEEIGMYISATVNVQDEQKYYIKYVASQPQAGYFAEETSPDVIINLNDYKESQDLNIEIIFECEHPGHDGYGGELKIDIYKNILTGEMENKQIQKIWVGTPEGNKEVTNIYVGTPNGNKQITQN